MTFHDSVSTTTSVTSTTSSQDSPQLTPADDFKLQRLPSYDAIHNILLPQQWLFSTKLDVFTDLKEFEAMMGFKSDKVPVQDTESIINKVRNLFSRCGSSNDKKFNNPFNYETLQQRHHDLLDEISRHKDAIKHLHDARKHCEKMEKEVLKTKLKLINIKERQLNNTKTTKIQSVLFMKQNTLDHDKSNLYETYLNEMFHRETLIKMANDIELEALCRIEMCVAKLLKYHGQDVSAAKIEEYAETIYRQACDSRKLMVPGFNIIEVLEPCCNEWTGQTHTGQV